MVYSVPLAAFIAGAATTMFVRFRSTRARLQASLIRPRRIDGKVRAEHVAALGSIAQPANIIRLGRVLAIPARAARKAGEPPPDPGPVYAAIHARIPLPTAEQRAAMIETAEADARLWERLRDMHQSTADEHKEFAGDIERKVQEGRTAAARAAEDAAAANERVTKLKRGEAVNGGLHRPFDVRQAFRDAGWSARDMAHARNMSQLSEAQFEEYLAEAAKRDGKARRRIERALVRQIRSRASP